MASSSVSQSPMCHCLVLEIIQFLGTVETPCLQDPSDTSPLLISPLFEFAKLTDTAEVVACCAAFLSSSLEASSEDIKINYQRQEDINDLFLAGRLGSRIETDEAAAEPLQLYLSPFCFLRQFPAQCCGHRGSVAPPVSPLAILQPPWHRLQ